MNHRPKLTIAEQVEYMRDDCGILFNICSEDEAQKFLSERTYFFKVKAFAKDFHKNPKTNKYIDLDFAYLAELSRLDMHIRRLILPMTVDIEHFLKVGLIKHLSDTNCEEDGYEIVERFFKVFPSARAKICEKSENAMCSDLTRKLELEGYALWNIIEIMSFGDFINLYAIYSQNYNLGNEKIINLLFPVKCLRNAAAHNNCLINSLAIPYSRETKISSQLNSYVSKVPDLSKAKKMLDKKLSNPVIHDFVALLFLFDKTVNSSNAKKRAYSELHTLFHERMLRHANYFEKNEVITSTYEFCVKIVDFLSQRAYTMDVEQKPNI